MLRCPRQPLHLACAALLLCVAARAEAERLPLKQYTSADGLAHDRVSCIVPDVRGFLWLCTPAGLSRFDGQRFLTYTADDGLPHPVINSFLQTRSGDLWVATNGGGVARFDPAAVCPPDKSTCRFTPYRVGTQPQAARVNALHEDPAGRLWAGTDGGLFVLDRLVEKQEFSTIALNLSAPSDDSLQIWSFADTPDGSLWIGTSRGLVRRTPDGRTAHYAIDPHQGVDHVWSLLARGRHRLWMAHNTGVVAFDSTTIGGIAGGVLCDVTSCTIIKDLPTGTARALFGDVKSEDRIWIGTAGGLVALDDERIRSYVADGLSGIQAMRADLGGNLWIGTAASGAMRLARNGFTTYGATEGFAARAGAPIVLTKAGDLYVVTRNGSMNRFDGRRFTTIGKLEQPRAGASDSGYGSALVDHAGEWWVAVGSSLHRFPRLNDIARSQRIRPKAVYTSLNGMASAWVYRLFEDSDGDIWIGTVQPAREGLVKWERATGQFRHYTEANALPRFHTPRVFAEGPRGTVWIGMWEGGLARYRDGRFTVLSAADGVPSGGVAALYVDRRGQLWVGSSRGGLGRVDDPGADRPRFTTYTTRDGLFGNSVTCITEDAWGRIYLGGTRGLDQLDPATGHVRHYTTADGLPTTELLTALGDHGGALWFGTYQAVSRFTPEQMRRTTAPTTFIGAVRVAGEPHAMPDWGEQTRPPLELESGRNQLQIEFFGLPFSEGATLRYRYKLEGADRDWSAPTAERSVNYARLAAGTYRFVVEAINADGVASPQPAAVAIHILPPFWARWWFVAIVGAGLAVPVFAMYRYRLARAIELERVRMRIATDLHDDIGASLSQIAILSEVARQRAGPTFQSIAEPLTSIAGTARELLDSVNDIVWAINPRRDTLHDLAQRMRRFASDSLTARNIELTFDAPNTDLQALTLGADVRRHVLLVFKESINNIVRHSGCQTVATELRLGPNHLELRVSDDGHGFDAGGDYEGHGLTSIRQRGRELGGHLEVVSAIGRGTCVTLTVPLRSPRARTYIPA